MRDLPSLPLRDLATEEASVGLGRLALISTFLGIAEIRRSKK